MSTRRAPSRCVRRGPRRRDERGSMAVEMVLMIPILFLFTLFVVAGGRFVSAKADADSTARDAARAASLTRSAGEAQAAIDQTIAAGLRSTRDCRPTGLSDPGDFRSGGAVTVRITCAVSLRDLGLLGLPGTVDIEARGDAPIDTYRRTG